MKDLLNERKQIIESLPSRLFSKGHRVVSQQYYRFVRGQKPSNAADFDARLHIYEDGTATLAEARQSGQKECDWWEVILPNGEYVFYILYRNPSQDNWNYASVGGREGIRKFHGKILDKKINWECIVPHWRPSTRMYPFENKKTDFTHETVQANPSSYESQLVTQ